MPDSALPPENSNTHPSADGDGGDGAAEPAREEAVSSESGRSALVPESPSEAAQDRRFSPRRKKLLRVQLQDALGGSTPFPGWVVDRSLGGMCLEVDRELETGTMLKVRRYEGTNLPWVEIRVQSQRLVDGVWHLGCQFVRSPSWEVLMQFG
jgi:PilZ domain